MSCSARVRHTKMSTCPLPLPLLRHRGQRSHVTLHSLLLFACLRGAMSAPCMSVGSRTQALYEALKAFCPCVHVSVSVCVPCAADGKEHVTKWCRKVGQSSSHNERHEIVSKGWKKHLLLWSRRGGQSIPHFQNECVQCPTFRHHFVTWPFQPFSPVL